MCGRFSQFTDVKIVKKYFQIDDVTVELNKDYNISPGRNIPTIIKSNDQKILNLMKWGMIPYWEKRDRAGKLINIRAETLLNKKTFNKTFREKRCLIVADGFYEWDKKTKQPYYIYRADNKPIAFAGLWKYESENYKSCSIITTKPNKKIKAIHNRMPVFINKSNINYWLNTSVFDKSELKNYLTPANPDSIKVRRVSRFVNNPKNNTRECIKEV
ncbi:MAG TPA: SOS response-associated peptidase [Candidatus Mcinerneyibacterium sp.]|nr:SOS response-associated peptidase [Candidatus Mcinerneyibacterium sp.]